MSLLQRLEALVPEPPPDVFFEVTESSLSAAPPSNPAAQRQELLPERGALASPSSANILKPHLYAEALSRLSSPAGKLALRSKNGRHLTAGLVIPDYAVRMSMLDFEQFPPGEPERLSLLRFRLRKSVPFPVEEAQLSYAVQGTRGKEVDVLVVSVARPILEEYEGLLSTAGLRVGLVVPSSIAALPLCPPSERGLSILAKMAGTILTLMLLDVSHGGTSSGRILRLIRCLDLSGEDAFGFNDERLVLSSLRQTLAYAEDELHQPVTRLLLCGFGSDTDSLGGRAESDLGISYAPLRSKFGAALQANAGLMGLLEQHAA